MTMEAVSTHVDNSDSSTLPPHPFPQPAYSTTHPAINTRRAINNSKLSKPPVKAKMIKPKTMLATKLPIDADADADEATSLSKEIEEDVTAYGIESSNHHHHDHNNPIVTSVKSTDMTEMSKGDFLPSYSQSEDTVFAALEATIDVHTGNENFFVFSGRSDTTFAPATHVDVMSIELDTAPSIDFSEHVDDAEVLDRKKVMLHDENNWIKSDDNDETSLVVSSSILVEEHPLMSALVDQSNEHVMVSSESNHPPPPAHVDDPWAVDIDDFDIEGDPEINDKTVLEQMPCIITSSLPDPQVEVFPTMPSQLDQEETSSSLLMMTPLEVQPTHTTDTYCPPLAPADTNNTTTHPSGWVLGQPPVDAVEVVDAPQDTSERAVEPPTMSSAWDDDMDLDLDELDDDEDALQGPKVASISCPEGNETMATATDNAATTAQTAKTATEAESPSSALVSGGAWADIDLDLDDDEGDMMMGQENTNQDLVHKATQQVALAEQEERERIIAEHQARALAEQHEREVAEQQARELAEQQARELAEQQARELAEQQAREVAEQLERELAEQQARELAEQLEREVAEQQAREVAEQQAREVAEQQARELAEQLKREVAEQQARELAEQQERDRQAHELVQQQERELAEQQERELAEQQARELAEQQERELAEQQERELAEQQERELAEQQQRDLAEQQERELAEQQQRHARELAEQQAVEQQMREFAEQQDQEMQAREQTTEMPIVAATATTGAASDGWGLDEDLDLDLDDGDNPCLYCIVDKSPLLSELVGELSFSTNR